MRRWQAPAAEVPAAAPAGQAAAGRGARRSGWRRSQVRPAVDGAGGRGGQVVLAVAAALAWRQLPAVTPGPAVSSMEIINALLAAGADPNAQLSTRRPGSRSGGRFSDPMLSTGTTPLYRAVMNNDMEVIRVLLDHGASPNIFDMGITPFLLAAGVEAVRRPRRWRCAAARAANTALLDLFMEHGADINTRVTGVAAIPCASHAAFRISKE